MNVRSGDKIPISAFFSYNWVPVVPLDTPILHVRDDGLVDIASNNLMVGDSTVKLFDAISKIGRAHV